MLEKTKNNATCPKCGWEPAILTNSNCDEYYCEMCEERWKVEIKEILVETKKYFTPEEVENFKKASIPYPIICYEGDDVNNVTQVTEIISMSGMANNNGIPTELIMYRNTAGKKKIERLIYKLEK